VVKILKSDPIIALILLMLFFWSALLGVFYITKTLLIPIGEPSHTRIFYLLTIHAIKSIIFLFLIAVIFYFWYKLTKFARDKFLAN
jgi:hypothetical protein